MLVGGQDTPKAKCFLWLSLQNKLDACDNLNRKLECNLGACVFSNDPMEMVDHIFIKCYFIKAI